MRTRMRGRALPARWGESDQTPSQLYRISSNAERVRRNAAVALGEIEPQQARVAMPVLIEALKDEKENMRESAAAALGKIAIALRCEKRYNSNP